MPPKQRDVERVFEYKAEEKSVFASTDLDAPKWLNTRAYIEPAPTPHGEVGWICPVCGRGLAPSMSWCPCHASTRTTATTTQSSTPTCTFDDVEEHDWTMTMTMSIGAIDYADGSSETIYPSVDDESRSVD